MEEKFKVRKNVDQTSLFYSPEIHKKVKAISLNQFWIKPLSVSVPRIRRQRNNLQKTDIEINILGLPIDQLLLI